MEGELLPDWFLGMRQVRISLNDHHVVALFTPGHIYPTPADANSALGDSVAKLPDMKMEYPATPDEAIHPFKPVFCPWFEPKPSVGEFVAEAIADVKSPSKTFLMEHWNHEHNHLDVDHLDAFYEIWKQERSRYYVGVDPAKPGDDHTSVSSVFVGSPAAPATTPVASASGPSDAGPNKLTKKQLRSTNTIHFTDSVQTSIFDLL